MAVTGDRIRRLQRLGLSEYGARAYLALLEHGSAGARDVSATGGVPLSKAYNVLDQLHAKGLVRVLPERPKRYAPVPIGEVVRQMRRVHDDAARELERERPALVEEFPVRGTEAPGSDRGEFGVVRGRVNVVERLRGIFARADVEVLALATPGMVRLAAALAEEVRDARRRGVAVRLLAPVSQETLEPTAALSAEAEVRARDAHGPTRASHAAIVLADRRQALVVNFHPDDGALRAGRDVAIETDQEGIVGALHDLAEGAWGAAPSYADRRREVESGLPPSFARFYRTQADAFAALEASLAEGVREFRSVSAMPARPPVGPGLAIAERVRASGARCFGIVNVQEADAADAYLRSLEGGWEFRHLEQSTVSRFVVLDAREVFFGLIRPSTVSYWDPDVRAAEAADLVLHTNDPLVVRSLLERFEELWPTAEPLRDRAAKLAGR